MKILGNTAAFVCEHVFGATRPVLYVCRSGGDWQFLCGGDHGPEETPRLVGVGHLIERDPSLETILDLPRGWEAERESALSPWSRTRIPRAETR